MEIPAILLALYRVFPFSCRAVAKIKSINIVGGYYSISGTGDNWGIGCAKPWCLYNK